MIEIIEDDEDLRDIFKKKKLSFDEVQILNTEVGQDSKYHLTAESIRSIKEVCEECSQLENANVIIFASCFSFFSEIKHIMRSSGLLSVVSMKEDRGDISFSKVFKLGNDQNEVLEAAVKTS